MKAMGLSKPRMPLFTGYTPDGGFTTAVIADARFAFPLGEAASDVSMAPLLCAGLIGWRYLKIADEGAWAHRRLPEVLA